MQVSQTQEPLISNQETAQPPISLSSRYTISEEHQKAKDQFMEKERENARMEAKRRKLMEKRVRLYLNTVPKFKLSSWFSLT